MNNRKSKNIIMRILNHDGNIKLLYTHRVVKKKKKYKTKDGEKINAFYQAYFPEELIEYLQIKDKTIYFYEEKKKIYITGVKPDKEYKQIRIQSSNQFSIPSMFFESVENRSTVFLKLDLSKKDPFLRRAGLLSMYLK